MTAFESFTQWATIVSPIIAVLLSWIAIHSNNKTTKKMLECTRENSRVATSEHLSLYRIEAFYNEVRIHNHNFDIQTLKEKISKENDVEKKKELEREMKRLEMNLLFLKIRNEKLIQNDLALQNDLKELSRYKNSNW